MKPVVNILVIFFIVPISAFAQQIVSLYDSTPSIKYCESREMIYGSREDPISYFNVTFPTLRIYLPPRQVTTGAGILIFPGGGYGGLAYQAEGTNIADYFVKRGIAAFVVKYRMPNDLTMIDKSMGPLQDAQQAIKIVRMNANKWNLDRDKIGVIGFSAGGHLASSMGTHFDKDYIPNIEKVDLRPAFMVLLYPVISMNDSIAHQESKTNLLGKKASCDKVHFFSNENWVTEQTPPTWISHAEDDSSVKIQNSIVFYESLLKHRISAEMHLYAKGGHSFVLNIAPEEWLQPILNWIENVYMK